MVGSSACSCSANSQIVFTRDVPKRLRAKRGIDPKISQLPDDRIGRKTIEAWLARVPITANGFKWCNAPGVVPVSRSTLYTPFSVSESLISLALQGDLGTWRDVLTLKGRDDETESLKEGIVAQATLFGPTHFETGCGFKVRGARMARAICFKPDIEVELLGSEGDIIRISGSLRPTASVLLVLENGLGIVAPALPDFIGAFSFDGDQLVNLSYEPSENSGRWADYAARAEELRSLRASIAASARLGVFRLDEEGQLALARRMQFAKSIDPSLALYAAYSYDGLQRRDLIDEMRSFLQADLGMAFFDIALLSSAGAKEWRFGPPFPMLSQGWTPALCLRCRIVRVS